VAAIKVVWPVFLARTGVHPYLPDVGQRSQQLEILTDIAMLEMNKSALLEPSA
jgi:hypothetical protein